MATNRINNKVYIGQTVQKFRKRINHHLRDARNGRDLMFHRAIRKHGAENFTWEIIYHADNLKDLNAAEEYLIKEYNSTVKGYNVKHGGNNNKLPIETRRKISEANRGRFAGERNPNFGKKHSNETKKRIGDSNRGKLAGEKNPNFGKKIPEETRKRISEANKGRRHSEETRMKMSKALKGRRLSNEHRQKISESHKGIGHSTEALEKMSTAKRGENNHNFDKTIYAFRHENYGLAFCTRYDLEKEFKFYGGGLSRLLTGRFKSIKGWQIATPEYLENLKKEIRGELCRGITLS